MSNLWFLQIYSLFESISQIVIMNNFQTLGSSLKCPFQQMQFKTGTFAAHFCFCFTTGNVSAGLKWATRREAVHIQHKLLYFQEMGNILQGNQTKRWISYTLQASSNIISKLFMSIIERDVVNSAASFSQSWNPLSKAWPQYVNDWVELISLSYNKR